MFQFSPISIQQSVYLYQQVPGVMHATTLEGVGAFNRLSSVQARGKSHDLNAEVEDTVNEMNSQRKDRSSN